ncbi:MAG: head completion/stabilization protein [Georgfuchsia sp.]
MAFVINSPAVTPEEAEIANGDFWPAIDPVQMRADHRIDQSITSERLRAALIEAIASVNGELATWTATKIATGATTIDDVEAEMIDDTSILVHRYFRAVGCTAKADVTERMRDYDTTHEGQRQADALNPVIDELRRDARWAISAILGLSRSTIELI